MAMVRSPPKKAQWKDIDIGTMCGVRNFLFSFFMFGIKTLE